MNARARVILAHNLKMIRLSMSMTQKQVAELCKVSCRGYSKIERCECGTSIDTLDKLAKGLGVSILDLLAPIRDNESVVREY